MKAIAGQEFKQARKSASSVDSLSRMNLSSFKAANSFLLDFTVKDLSFMFRLDFLPVQSRVEP